MTRRKVCVVITARPSYSRVKTALEAIREHPDLELQLVVAASALLDRYGNAVDQMIADGFEISAQVYMVLEGENLTSMAKTTGIGLVELATVLDNLAPDLVLTIADRFETMATAVAAAYMNIPLVHLQGGEVSGSIDEKVRHSITKLADAHLVSTERAAQRVIQMGERPDRVHLTGCPSVDIAAQILDDPRLDFDPFERYGGVGESFDLTKGYAVVLQHPVTTEYAASRQHAIETLEAVRALDLPAFWFWPNVDAGSDGTSKALRAYREHFEHEDIHFFKNMAPSDFLKLIYNSSVLIGNSSVGIRECSFLGVPVVNIGTRQQGRERGQNVVDCDYGRDEILKAALKQIGAGRYPCDTTYGDGGAGKRVADVLTVIPLEVEKHLTY